MRFLGFVLVFLIGGAIGFFLGTLGGASAGALTTACELIDTGVADGSFTQDAANKLLRTQIDKLNLGNQRATVIDQAKKIAKPGPCVTALDAAATP
jgi:hypothetical protein